MKTQESIEALLFDLGVQAREISRSKKNPFNLMLRQEPKPNAPITSSVLDEYVESIGYQGIDAAWIELSRVSAHEYLEKILRVEQIEWFGYESPEHSALDLAKKFIGVFTHDARFFTHGLSTPLKEFPVVNPTLNTTIVELPFSKRKTATTQFEAYAALSEDPLDSPEGILAVDSQTIGSVYFKLF